MLDAEPDVGIVVERLISGFVDVRGLQRDGLVTVFLGHFYPAIPVAVLYICSAEDDEASFELLNIDEEGHEGVSFCAGFVYIWFVTP